MKKKSKQKIDKKLIAKRRKKLDQCRAFLKQEFVGIDYIIDQLINHLQVWYLMPEVLSRPVIINLWGMTGVGKTDLIRKMVKFLEYQDRFMEIELHNSANKSWNTTVYDLFDEFELNDGEPSILLFDEIQRFRTISADGDEMQQTNYIDFWELLSDGKLSKKEKYDFDDFLMGIIKKRNAVADKKRSGQKVKYEEDTLSYWELKEFSKQLGIQFNPLEPIKLTEDKMFDLIMEAKNSKRIYEPIDHSKSLIIIGGNLDEAFQVAKKTSDADIDADIFYAFTEKVSLVDVKNALTKRFRPEQVARFGNIHLIYKSLTKANFETIIAQEFERVKAYVKDKFEIKLTIDQSFNQLIYQNGVFPVQGVRPVFSSVADILESNLGHFIFQALMDSKNKIHLAYDFPAKKIVADLGKERVLVDFVGRIDKIRESNKADAVASISVHEAGHAIVYMKEFSLVPLQLKSKVADSYAGGFTFPHTIHNTKQTILKQIKVYLAGGLAEELIFGQENASIGRSHDREEASKLAARFVRKYGFVEEFQADYSNSDDEFSLDRDKTDESIEQLLQGLVRETKDVLLNYKSLLIQVSKKLAQTGVITSQELFEMSKSDFQNVEIRNEGYLHIENFSNKLENT